MAVYTVRAPDGATIELTGPDGASQEEVIAQAQRLYAQRQAAPAAAEPAPTGRRITSFQRGPSPEDMAAAQATAAEPAPTGRRIVSFERGPRQEGPGLVAQVKEAFTGAARMTPEIEQLPDIGAMPERNQFSEAGFKAAFGQIAASSPQELVQVIGANFPDVQARVDAKGNYILRSAIDGREYAIKPGFQASDIAPAVGKILPQVAASQLVAPAAAAMGLGKAAQLASALMTAGVVQTATEEVSAMAGGQVEPGEVAKAVAGEALGQGVGAALRGGVSLAKGGARAVKQAFRRAAPEAAEQTFEQAATVATQAQPVPSAGGAPQAAPAAPAAAPAQQFLEPTELANIVRKASRGGIGSAEAKQQLVDLARVNPQAKADAEALGIDLPIDVFADNPQLRAAAGLVRSQAGGAEEAAYRETIKNAATRADDLMREFGATFVEGKPAPAEVSDRVLASLTEQSKELAAQAKPLFDQFDAAVGKETKITLPDLAAELESVTKTVLPSQLTKAEKGLLALVRKNDKGELVEIPYNALMREKRAIFDQVEKRIGNKYKDVDQVQLERYYDILRKEQLAVAERLGDTEAASAIADANVLWAKKKALDSRVVEGFGTAADNSVAKLMKSALKGAAEGDRKAFNQLSDIVGSVPPELRRETFATALANSARSGAKIAGMDPNAFGFAEYAKLYQGLRGNPKVYKEIVDALGPGADETLRRLYEVSKRVTDARANVLGTGKANQAYMDQLNVEGAFSRFADAALRGGAGKVATTALGATVGGPVGAAAAAGLINAAGLRKSGVKAASDLFASEEFKRLLSEAAVRPASDRNIRSLAVSPVFAKFANAVGLPRAIEDRDRWIRDALATQATQQPTEEQPTP
jgi:hypothetical protein